MPAGSNTDLGDHLIINNLSAGALNADLVPATDVSAFKWISLYIGSSVYSGFLTPQISFDQTTWITIQMYSMTDLNASATSSGGVSGGNLVLATPVFAPFFRVRMTSYTSGTANGVLQLYASGLAGFQLLHYYAIQDDSLAYSGYINNDGKTTVEIPAGQLADTIILAGSGFLAKVLVTTTGTNQMTIYDNASAPSGAIIGFVPASTPLTGVPIESKMPAINGIYVAGNSNNPGVTISYHTR